MKFPEFCLLLPLLAFLLDLFLGDPRWLPHPVLLLGRFYNRLKGPVLAAKNQYFSGALALGGIAAFTGSLVWLLVSLPGIWGNLLALYLAWSGLALGCLLREGRKALSRIQNGSLEGAREAVGMLVSRETSQMDRPELYKTLAESLAENFNDGFVAPFFWLLVGGPIGLWVYKAVSTGDSMWGYKHEPWSRAGFAAARLDDILAWIPARLSLLFLLIGARNRSAWPGFSAVAGEARLMESPNAGWSMAAAAWLHEAHMGGAATYAGERKEKPILGPRDEKWDDEKIENLLSHMRQAGIIAALAMWCIYFVLNISHAYY